MLYLEVQIFFALLLAVILGWFVTRLLGQNREKQLISENTQLKAGNNTLKDDLEKQRKETIRVEEQLSQAKQQVEETEQEKHDLKQQLFEKRGKINNLSSEQKFLQEKQTGTDQALKSTETQRDGFKERLNAALQKKQIQDEYLLKKEQEIKTLESRIQTLETQKNDLAVETVSLTYSKEDFHAKLKSATFEGDSIKTQLEQQQRTNQELREQLTRATRNIEELRGNINALKQEKESAHIKTQMFEERHTELDKQIKALSKERDELRIRLFTVEELTRRITSPMRNDRDSDSTPVLEADEIVD